MFKDRNEALHRLEEALLEEEETALPEETEEDEELLGDALLDELLEDTAPSKESVAYQNYSNDYGNSSPESQEEAFCAEAPRKKKDQFGIVIIACLLLTGILCVLAYVLLRRGGLL